MLEHDEAVMREVYEAKCKRYLLEPFDKSLHAYCAISEAMACYADLRMKDAGGLPTKRIAEVCRQILETEYNGAFPLDPMEHQAWHAGLERAATILSNVLVSECAPLPTAGVEVTEEMVKRGAAHLAGDENHGDLFGLQIDKNSVLMAVREMYLRRARAFLNAALSTKGSQG